MEKKTPLIQKDPQTHTVEYYSVIKKNELLPFSRTWFDWKVCEIEEDKCCRIPFIWGIKK